MVSYAVSPLLTRATTLSFPAVIYVIITNPVPCPTVTYAATGKAQSAIAIHALYSMTLSALFSASVHSAVHWPPLRGESRRSIGATMAL